MRPTATPAPAAGRACASRRPGPGATNLVTGLATAHMDNTPLVAITGQVPRAMIGRDAFQETDIIGITQPITKHNRLVEDVEELADAVHEAFAVAQEGRPGPVLLDVPKDVQNQKLDCDGRRRTGARRGATAPRAADRPADADGARSRPRRLIGRGRAAADHGRPRRHPERRLRRAAGAGRAHRHPGHHHAARHQRVSRSRTRSTSACRACTARCTSTAPSSRPTSSSASGSGSTTG